MADEANTTDLAASAEPKITNFDAGEKFDGKIIPLTSPFQLGGVVYTAATLRIPTGADYEQYTKAGATHGIRSSLERGAEYQHEDTALSNAGRSMSELAEMHEAARRVVATVPTASFTETLKALNETTSAFGSVEHAVENLPFVMRTASVLHAAAGDKISGDAGDMGNLLARFFEERGTAGDPHVFQHEANELVRSMVFTRGNFNPREALNFAQQAKSALQNYDLEFLTRVVPTIASTMGGERAGTAAKAFDDVIMGKVNDAKQAGAWQDYGLIDPSLAVKKNGKTMGWKAGAVEDTNLARTNPLKFMTDVVLPALKAHGVDINDRLELSKALATLYRNPNANFFANELAQPQQVSRLRKDAKLIEETKTPDQMYANNLQSDPTVAMKALTASIENLQTVATSPAMATAAKGITAVAGGLQSLAQWGGDNPNKAMGAGAALGVAGLGGSGYLLYKLSTGFGLSTSATQLSTAAAALEGAAAKLGGGRPGLPGGSPGGPGDPNIKGPGLLRMFPYAWLAYDAATNIPKTPEEWKKQAAANDERKKSWGDWIKDHTPAWMNPDKAWLEKAVEPTTAGGGGRGRAGTPFMGKGGGDAPVADNSQLDETKAKAESAKQTLDLLNGTVQPKVDLTGLERFVALVNQANAGLDRLGSRSRPGGMSFSPSPGALHDGPEAH